MVVISSAAQDDFKAQVWVKTNDLKNKQTIIKTNN
jgi:hypothetical protein